MFGATIFGEFLVVFVPTKAVICDKTSGQFPVVFVSSQKTQLHIFDQI